MTSRDQVLTNARVFTAIGDSVIPSGAVWVSGNTIRYAGPKNELPPTPAGTNVVDVAGKFVMPGMTETHAHLSFADASPFAIGATPVEEATITAVKNAALMLASGFTSAISFGSTYRIDVALRDAINAGRIVGPRLLAAGRDLGATGSNVDAPGGLSQIDDGPWALRKAVREQRKLRVDIVKIFIDGEAINPVNPPGELSFCDEEVAAIVDEAHRRKLRVACHARSAAAVKQAVRAGVDFVGHANYLDDEAVQLLASHRDRIFVGPAIAWEVQYLAQCETLGVSKATVRKQGYEAEIDATISERREAARSRRATRRRRRLRHQHRAARHLRQRPRVLRRSVRHVAGGCVGLRDAQRRTRVRPARQSWHPRARIVRRSRRRRRGSAVRHPHPAGPREARGDEGRVLVLNGCAAPSDHRIAVVDDHLRAGDVF